MHLRIFVSSPGDVGEERRLTEGVIERLRYEWSGRVDLEPIFWEHEPLRATESFQKEIPRPSQADIVVCILWSRLGTKLPPGITRKDGSRYASGTEYEFEDAKRAYEENGTPDLLVYRKTAPAVTQLDSKERVNERLEQKEALDAFVERWFREDGSFTAAFHAFSDPAQYEEHLREHLDKLIDRRVKKELGDSDEERTAPLWDKGSPFRGLESFGPEHAPVFCGRTAEVADVLNQLRRQNAAAKPFVLVLGPSGCGKSSLVRAGVLPGLTHPNVIEGIGVWRSATFTPGTASGDLLTGLAAALFDESALGNELRAVGSDVAQLAAQLRDEPGTALPLLRSALAQVGNAVQRREELENEPEVRLALVIDQLEELFTVERFTPAGRERFDAAVATLVRGGTVWALATLRSDFYSRFTELTQLTDLKEGSGQYDLRRPTKDEIAQMIRQPARIAGLRFEEDAHTRERLDEVLRDAAVSDTEVLPLLEFTLDELYKLRDGNVLTLAAYRKLGGVEGALASRAEEVFSKLEPGAQGELGRLLAALVTINDEGAPSRRRASLDRLTTTPAARELVDTLIANRLLVTDRGEDGSAVATVAHEALLLRWPRAQKWLRDNLALLRQSAKIKALAAAWHEDGENPDFHLAEGELLYAAETTLPAANVPLTDQERTFVEASRAALEASGRKRRMVLWGAVAAAVLLALATYVALDLYVLSHVEHYHTSIRRWGEPEGVGELASGDRKRRQASFEFHQRGRRGVVHEVRAVNSSGRLTALHQAARYIGSLEQQGDLASSSRECAWRFEYRDRELTRETALNCFGQPVYEFLYTERTRDAEQVKAQYVNDGIAEPQAESGAAVVQLTRNAEGLDRRVEFLGVRGQPRSDPTGSYGLVIEEFHTTGQPRSVMNLGKGGVPAVHRYGFVRSILDYDDRGRILEWRFLGADNQPMLNFQGFSKASYQYDEYGNVSRIDMFDELGEPLRGVAANLSEYDKRGNQTSIRFLNAAGQPAFNSWGFTGIEIGYDDRGNPISLSFQDEDGEPMAVGNGVARIHREYDDNDHLSAWAFFDEQGAPTHRGDGVSRVEYRSDVRGNVVEARYRGVDGEPVAPRQLGYATVRRTYDASNRLVAESYLDGAGEPIRDLDGVLGRRYGYNPDGHRISATNVDTTGQPMSNRYGESRIEWIYGDDREFVGERYLDVRGQLVASRGFSSQEIYYDERGNVARLAFFDAEAQLFSVVGSVLVRSRPDELPGPWWQVGKDSIYVPGCVAVDLDYDSVGRRTEVTCLDNTGNKTPGANGYAIARFHYDELSRAIGISYLDSEGSPISPSVSSPGFSEPILLPARTRAKLNRLGQQIEETYLDAGGQPTLHPAGHAKVEYAYDRWGRVERETYVDAADRPTLNPLVGYATVASRYDDSGSPIEESRFDESGRLLPAGPSRIDFDYSDPGLVQVTARDSSGGIVRAESVERQADPDMTWAAVQATATYRGGKSAPRVARSAPPPTPTRTEPTSRRAEPTSTYAAKPPADPVKTQEVKPTPGSDPTPIVPATGDLNGIVDSLYELSETILDTHEDYLDDNDLDEGPLYERLDEFYEAADEMRTAYRRATGQTVGRRFGIVGRSRSDQERAQAFANSVRELARIAAEIDRRARSESLGPAATREWRQIRSYLARIESET